MQKHQSNRPSSFISLTKPPQTIYVKLLSVQSGEVVLQLTKSGKDDKRKTKCLKM